ncbi:hypothetical protein [Flavobacterium sp.]|uniref:hypothetical protein n=1 Tax=Flavobacterium sp. TaxID=239 RepID=UPI00286C2F6D|nr:hypothetical protein [Flavobacterium sp.]
MIFETKTTAKNKVLYSINVAYFALAFIQIVAELLDYNNTALSIRIILPLLLLALYHINSIIKNILFYIVMGLLLISNILFFYINMKLFFYGIIAFILLRIITLVIVFKLTEDKNYLHIVVASFPFLVIFFYLISATNEISEYEFNLLILQSVLISLLGGISIVNYFKNDNRQNSWLLISTLLFVGLRFIVFIERYFSSNLTLAIYRPIEIILSVFAFYTFYKYVIAAESKENKNFITNSDES